MAEPVSEKIEQLESRLQQLEQNKQKKWFHLPSTILGMLLCSIFLAIAGYADTPSSISRTDFISGTTISSSTFNTQLNAAFSAINQLLTKIQIVSGAVNLNANTTITGRTTVSDTTESTSTSTGAIVSGGGLGVAKNANIGGNLNVTGQSLYKNRSAFIAARVSSNQTITTGTPTRVMFNSVDPTNGILFDVNGDYSTADGFFTVPVDGIYNLFSTLHFGASLSAGSRFEVTIDRYASDGSTSLSYLCWQTRGTSTGDIDLKFSISCNARLLAGQKIGVFVRQYSGSNQELYFSDGAVGGEPSIFGAAYLGNYQ
ncbi:MAG: hypothetical protein HQM12_23165 [SAR324 cluster bacterium]|nr:hypothetical protein [SAR324 cluster bacterium]